MHLENFNIAKNFGAIEVCGSYIDLHNNFDFKGLEYDVSNRVLRLHWALGAGDWIPKNSPAEIQLVFRGVYLFKAKERDSQLPFSEDDCLSTLGFIGNDLINEVEGFCDLQPSENTTHLNISFMSGFALKVGCETATCLINKKGNK